LQASFFTLGFGFLSLLDLLPCTWYLEALLASVLGLISCLRATHPSLTLCNVHLTCDVHYVSIIQFLDHHTCSLVLNPVDFTLSTCSTLSTLVSPLIELSSKHQNSQESFHYPAEQRAILRKCLLCCILHGCLGSVPLSDRIVLREGLCTPKIIVRTAHQASSLPLVRV
jgi:hypothetical protein